MSRQLRVYPDLTTLTTTVASQFVDTVAALLRSQQWVHVTLTGGTAGIATLAAIRLATAPDSDGARELDWSRVHFWWGDERWVPLGDADRNDAAARTALLDHIAVPDENVHPFAASDQGVDLHAAVEQYTAELRRYARPGDECPAFDITFLGVGPDGHVASLFPGHAGERITDRTVISVHDSPKPPPTRLSLTRPVLNSSARVWMVMAGADKASALARALDDGDVPAAAIHGRDETVFFTDKAASGELV